MADVSKSHPVFLGFCHDALGRLRRDDSLEAARIRARIEALVTELESWITAKALPESKESTIAAVLEVYRDALHLETSMTKRKLPLNRLR